MHQLIDKKKIYFYFFLPFILLSIHNINFFNSVNDYFKIKKIILISNIENSINKEINKSLNQFYNFNIFSINTKEISNTLENFNIISEYNVKKKYPSSITVELKETRILAYYFESNSEKIFIGENGKKIKNEYTLINDPPLIVGQVKIENFLNLKKILVNSGLNLNEFSKFYSYKSNRWDLVYQNKLLIMLPIEKVEKAIIIFKNIVESTNLEDLKTIDLRIEDKIILS